MWLLVSRSFILALFQETKNKINFIKSQFYPNPRYTFVKTCILTMDLKALYECFIL